jgi:DNA-binding SARP family transcriptional activator
MRVGVLGSLELHVDGVPIQVRSGRQRMAVVLLALAPNEVLSTDRLGDALWPNDAPTDVGRAVQSLIYRLRRRLAVSVPGSECHIVHQEPGYTMSIDPHQVDLHEFVSLVERGCRRVVDEPDQASCDLRRALALWRGEPLVDAAYAPGVAAEARRLTELRLGAVETLAAIEIDRGHTGSVIAELESLTASFPLRETLWSLLWTALARAHRTTEVTASFRRAEELLDVEYSLEPSAELRELAYHLTHAR